MTVLIIEQGNGAKPSENYFDTLSHYSANLFLVKVKYDETTETHECRIEDFLK